MSFMQRETHEGEYYLVDTPDGTHLVPLDVVGLLDENNDGIDGSTVTYTPQPLKDYVDSTSDPEQWEVTHHTGWYGRYSAPGYMDCTDWLWADTEEELIADLDALYGSEEDELTED